MHAETCRRKRKAARVLSRRLVYKGPIFWVTSDRVIEPSGVRVLREIVRHNGSIVILATTEDPREPQVLLERQYRHAAEDFLWELPAGRIDAAVAPPAGARSQARHHRALAGAGRSRTTFDEMVRLDLRYARSRSLWTDIKILLATPRAVIAGKGAC